MPLSDETRGRDRYETLETRGMSDRDLMLANHQKLDQVIRRLDEQNGTVRLLVADYYGDTLRGVEGTKPTVDRHDKDIDRGKTIGKTMIAVVSAIGAGNLILFLQVVP